MRHNSRRALGDGVFLLGVALVLFSGAATAQNRDAVASAEVIEQLPRGGYNIYVRHAATDWSQNDKIASREGISGCDGAKLRQLSDSGRGQASRTVAALAEFGIRFSAV